MKVAFSLRTIGPILLVLVSSTLATPGDTLLSLHSPGKCPQGLVYDGTRLWCADRMTDQIYAVDPGDGRVVDSLPTPGYVPRGLAWDGTWLWCVDAGEEQLYAVNPRSRIVTKTISCPVFNPTGLVWDGAFLWIASEGGERIYKISSDDGTTIESIPSPTSHTWGLAFDGKYLWVSDRFADMICMVSPKTGDVVVSLTAPGPHACGVAWDGKNLWNVDYQTDRIYKLVVDDGIPYKRLKEKYESVEFVHQVRNFGPDSVKTLDAYFAIPENAANQELTGPVTFEPAPMDTLTDKWGQKVAHFHVENLGPADFSTIKMMASARMYEARYFVFPDKVGKLSEIPRQITERFLADDTKFAMTSPVIQNAVKEAVGVEKNPYWIARKVFNYLIEKLEYELSGGWNVAPAILERGNGSCSEYTFVYIAMCRAAGLPARYAGSIVVRNDDASYDEVFHRWVEVYLPGYGWVPVDPSRGDKKWPAEQASSFGFLANSVLVTTVGGGGSEYLDWGYNANERWTGQGKCKVVVENFGEWTPVETAQ